MKDLFAALCLVAVLEGLMLFAAPAGWKRLAAQLLAMHDGALRRWGGVLVLLGIGCLWWLRQG